MSSFIPEKPILVFPSLAATIGLEEATLLSLLDEMTQYQSGQISRGHCWYKLDAESIQQYITFWDDIDIQRVSQRLRDVGMILIVSAPYAQSHELRFAFNEKVKGNTQDQVEEAQNNNTSHRQDVPHPHPQTQTTRHSEPRAFAHENVPSNRQNNVQNDRQNKPQNNRSTSAYSSRQLSQGATLLPPNWQPDKDTIGILAQFNIPEHFIREQLPEFVHYWRERAESHRTWGAKFVQHIKRQWTHYVAKTSNTTPLPANWQPSEELQQQIQQEGIPSTFVQKSLQRFSLYHKNSNAKNTHWDMPFFSWLKEDWDKQDTPFLNKKKSLALSPEWRPDKHTLTFLTVSHGIELSFIEDCMPEFIHKWIEKQAIHSEWGTIFAEHIIQQWRFVQAGVTRNPHPQIISSQWQPSKDCIELLCVHSGIEQVFIQQQIPEFILYWTNRAQAMHSWDNIFLRHVKHQWKQHYERQQPPSGSGRTKDRTVSEQLTDRSWAS